MSLGTNSEHKKLSEVIVQVPCAQARGGSAAEGGTLVVHISVVGLLCCLLKNAVTLEQDGTGKAPVVEDVLRLLEKGQMK